MKKKIMFWLKVVGVFCLVIGFLFGVVMPQYTESFNAAILDKVARLESMEGPKIVLIGNSNIVFGMDSQRLEEAFEMPVVNMGLHGALGNAFHEEMAKLNVQPGDLYIVCHTEYDDNDTILDPSLAWLTIENHLGLWRLIRPKDMWTMVDSYTTYLQKALMLWTEGMGNQADEAMYARRDFNIYGDNVYPRERRDEAVILPFEEQTVPPIGDICVNRLNALNAELTGKGATLLIAGYPIANGEHTPLVSEYEAFGEELSARLDAPVISYFSDYMIDYDQFYDTIYHLTAIGVQERTAQLIEDIRFWLETGKDVYEPGQTHE